VVVTEQVRLGWEMVVRRLEERAGNREVLAGLWVQDLSEKVKGSLESSADQCWPIGEPA
jgi:hypothetical protein